MVFKPHNLPFELQNSLNIHIMEKNLYVEIFQLASKEELDDLFLE